jgi:hypothetical protein
LAGADEDADSLTPDSARAFDLALDFVGAFVAAVGLALAAAGLDFVFAPADLEPLAFFDVFLDVAIKTRFSAAVFLAAPQAENSAGSNAGQEGSC